MCPLFLWVLACLSCFLVFGICVTYQTYQLLIENNSDKALVVRQFRWRERVKRKVRVCPKVNALILAGKHGSTSA